MKLTQAEFEKKYIDNNHYITLGRLKEFIANCVDIPDDAPIVVQENLREDRDYIELHDGYIHMDLKYYPIWSGVWHKKENILGLDLDY